MEHEAIQGRPALFPPGMVTIKLTPAHRSAYRRLYALSATDLAGLPKLRDRDFDGRPVKVAQRELDALNRALAGLQGPPPAAAGSAFEAQERSRTRLFKRLQHLS